MAQGDEYLNNLRSLANLYKERVTVEDIENEMTTTLGEIHTHVKMGKALDAQLAHHMLTTTGSTFTGGELAVSASRLWKTATYAKERLHSFTQRYMLVDAIYRMKVDEDAWIRNITDIEDELTRAEKMVQDEKVQNKETFVSVFNKTIEKLEKKIDDIALNLSKPAQGKKLDHSPPVKRKCYPEAEDQPTTSKMQVISDEEYMRNLIEECRDDDEASPEVAERNTERVEQDKRRRKHIQYEEDRLREGQRRQEEEQRRREEEQRRQEEERRLAEEERLQREQERQQYLHNLEMELDDLYKGRFLLPQRKFGEIPEEPVRVECSFCGIYGDHFSDSCTFITDGRERYNYIDQESRCKLCLRKGHATEVCRAKDQECWYCEIVQNTALSFLVDKQPHHRAICSIPDSKERITARIRCFFIPSPTTGRRRIKARGCDRSGLLALASSSG
ncbi:hypothetical protein OSTOST_06273 [Ostertagia ostertagi]